MKLWIYYNFLVTQQSNFLFFQGKPYIMLVSVMFGIEVKQKIDYE